MFAEITTGYYKQRIGVVTETTPLFVTIRLIVNGISTQTIDVYCVPGTWKPLDELNPPGP